MAKTRTPSLGVDWHLPSKKFGFQRRPFTSTTKASSDLIVLLAARGLTWSQLSEQILWDPEAKAVADRFVTEGYGDVPVMAHVGGSL
ncbi:hypothetical protein [Aeromicrobium sp. 179-A 4D2 NHS]|uniref:hypothetical protein n=1 Tax=Aeromicrobium sp. 179-A 4D2 NHS TaxID=3142375 RepID=UPI0039A11A5B